MSVDMEKRSDLCEYAYLQDVRSWFLNGVSEAEKMEESFSDKPLSLTVSSQCLTDLRLIGFSSHLQKQNKNHDLTITY